MKISQSLIKEVQKKDHCPKQIMYIFIEGREIEDIPEGWKMGRYFESELIGSCRGGEKQEASFNIVNIKPLKSANKDIIKKFLLDREVDISECKTKNDLVKKLQYQPSQYVKGEKHKAYLECDELVKFAKEAMKSLGLNIEDGESQLDIQTEFLKGAIDHRNIDIENPNQLANYDVKWTATKEDDTWNGWGNPADKFDAHTQAKHYTLVSYEETGKWMPFYFLVFGKSMWFKVVRFKMTEESIKEHKRDIAYTKDVIREYAENDYIGKGTFNKCNKCPFNKDCEDRVLVPEIETYNI